MTKNKHVLLFLHFHFQGALWSSGFIRPPSAPRVDGSSHRLGISFVYHFLSSFASRGLRAPAGAREPEEKSRERVLRSEEKSRERVDASTKAGAAKRKKDEKKEGAARSEFESGTKQRRRRKTVRIRNLIKLSTPLII